MQFGYCHLSLNSSAMAQHSSSVFIMGTCNSSDITNTHFTTCINMSLQDVSVNDASIIPPASTSASISTQNHASLELPEINPPSKCKREDILMENAGNALSTINTYIAAKQARTEDSCLFTFAKHLANELDAIHSD